MKTDIKRLRILRESYIKEREQKINEYERLLESGETSGLSALSESINLLAVKINNIDEKIGV